MKNSFRLRQVIELGVAGLELQHADQPNNHRLSNQDVSNMLAERRLKFQTPRLRLAERRRFEVPLSIGIHTTHLSHFRFSKTLIEYVEPRVEFVCLQSRSLIIFGYTTL